MLELNGSHGGWRQAAETIVGHRKGGDQIFGGTAARFHRVGWPG